MTRKYAKCIRMHALRNTPCWKCAALQQFESTVTARAGFGDTDAQMDVFSLGWKVNKCWSRQLPWKGFEIYQNYTPRM